MIGNVGREQHTQLRGSDVNRLVTVLELNTVTLDPGGTPLPDNL